MSTAVKEKKKQVKQMPEKKLKDFQKRLKQGLKDLESQYEELFASISNNKDIRQQMVVEGKQIQQRIRRLSNRLEKFSPYAQRQMTFLEKLKAFQDKNESLMLMIADRLEEIERTSNPQVSDVGSMKDDLLGMLGELSNMRKKREALLDSIKGNSEN